MQRAVIFLSCLVCLVAASSLGLERKTLWLENVLHGQESTKIGSAAGQSVHEQQKFLLDVLLQVQKPLLNRELLELGSELITDSAAYQEPIDEILLEFLQKAQQHDILGRNEISTDLDLEQSSEFVGLTKFLTLAKDWPTFQRNVCFARRHFNAVLFINALQIAVNEREDTQELIMPAMNEILPHLFYDKDVIITAENVDWNDLITKTSSKKPSLLNVLGLGNVLGVIGYPTHWIRMGKTGLWRPRQKSSISLISGRTGALGGLSGGLLTGQLRGQLGGQINLQNQLIDDETEQPGSQGLLLQSEEKIVIPLEQQTPLSYLTDDVALNGFWNSAMKERVVQSLTGNKHQGLSGRIGVEHSQHQHILSPFSHHQNRRHVIVGDEDEPISTKHYGAGSKKQWNQHLIGGKYALTDEDIELIGTNEDITTGAQQGQRMLGGQNERVVHLNRRYQNAQRKQQQQGWLSGLWSEEPETLSNVYGIYGQEGEQQQHQQTLIGNRGRLNTIRSGRKHGESSWGQKSVRIGSGATYTIPKWSRVNEEDEDEETTQQGGWGYGLAGRTQSNAQLRSKIGRNSQQIRHTVDPAHWMFKRTTDEATMPQRGMGYNKLVNMQQQLDEEAMQQRGMGTKQSMTTSIMEDEEIVPQRSIYNKILKSQLDQTEREEMMHSRLPRSIKTIDISPEDELMSARSGELFLQNIQQLVARINLEKLSLSQSIGIDTQSLDAAIQESEPSLLTTKGVQYQQKVLSPAQSQRKVQQLIHQLQSIIDNTLQTAQISQGNPDILEIVGDILVAQNTEQGNILDILYNEVNQAVFGLTVADEKATTLSSPTAALREPVYHDILASISDLIESYRQQVKPYKRHQILAPGIQINNVDVDELTTYFDATDADLINLVDQQLLQSNVNNLEQLEKKLVARQHRLNHKQFTLGYDIIAQRPQRVVVRTFLGPKYNENGQIVSLEETRQDHILLDAFVEDLQSGLNHIERNSRQITWAARDTSSFTEIYRRVMQGRSFQHLVGSDCRYPQRLILPRGTLNGLPMQLFVVVTPVTEEDRLLQQLVQPEELCGLGIAAMHLDKLPLGFPLDRPIENVVEFLQPNMILKDVVIVHHGNAQQI